MEDRSRNPLRLLAPIALAAFALAFMIVVISAGGGSDSAPTNAREAQQRDLGASTDDQTSDAKDSSATDTTETGTTDGGLPDDVYVVKSGDTLGAISEKVGVSVEQLQELNPDLDPQALVSGQQIKLRE